MAVDCREKILSQDYRDFIIPEYSGNMESLFPEIAPCMQPAGFGYRIVYVSAEDVPELTLERYGYSSIPGCYALTDLDALNKTGISAVQNYPTLQLQGNGILIGFVDTGIDYQNRVFQDAGGRTRIAAIWDQTVQSGPLPEGFAYGSEYTREMIDEALRLENPLDAVPSVDSSGHGTFVASVAAGSEDVANRFLGAAPQAMLAMVKLKEAKDYLREFYMIRGGAACYQETDIMQGLYYLNGLAKKLDMPLVICLALGTNFGGHNSTTLLSKVLGSYANVLDRCVVIAGGNEANERHHYFGVLETGASREVEIRVERGGTSFAAELWTTLPNVVTAYIVSPSGERSPSISIRQGSRFRFIFPFDQTKVEIEYRLFGLNNDSQLLFFRFDKPSQGIWRIGVEPVRVSDGEFHIWLPVKEFLDGNVYFLEANPDDTLTEPGSTWGAITVSFYNAADNSVDINSGRGYTRNRLIKPDFAAPGVQVTGAGTGGRFVARSGSSAAAGLTAGASALIMEWFLQQPGTLGITTSQVANIILLGVGQEVLPAYPNREWGYGTVDVYQSLDRLRTL